MVATLATVFPAAAQDRSAFEAELRRNRERMAAGDWSIARHRLAALTDEHGARPYVLARRSDVLEDWVRCAFFCDWEPPRPETLVAGRMVQRRGSVSLRYAAGQDGDFDVDPRGRARYHRAWFEGARTLELAGRRYPDTGAQLIAATDTSVSLIVDPGVAPFERDGALRHRVPTGSSS